MNASKEILVLPKFLSLFFRLAIGALGIVVGIFFIVGFGLIFLCVAVIVGVAFLLGCLLAITTRRPRVVIRDDGFTLYSLFGETSRTWDDVDGDFVVIKAGFVSGVGYNFSEAYKDRSGQNPKPLIGGYHAGITGTYSLSMQELADLLNEHVRRHSGRIA